MAYSQMGISGLLTEKREFCSSYLCCSAKTHAQGTQNFLCHFHSTSQELLDRVQEHIKADLNNKVRGFWSMA